MSNLWLKIKIWTKMLLVAAVIVYIILFTYFNAQHKVKFWYWWGHEPEKTVLLLVLCSFVAGVVGAFLLRTTYRTIKQVRDLQSRQRAQRLDREVADMKAKAAMLRSKPEVVPAPSESSVPKAPENDGQ